MIGFVRGTYVERFTDSLMVDVGGIGFRVIVPGNIFEKLPGRGTEVKLYTHLSVREDALTLFGFLEHSDLELFRTLIKVSGVGPKVAMALLGTVAGDDLKTALVTRDHRILTTAPGVGAKLAKKIVLELSDRLSTVDLTSGSSVGLTIDSPSSEAGDTVMALISMGFSPAEARSAYSKAVEAAGPGEHGIPEMIRLALKAAGRS